MSLLSCLPVQQDFAGGSDESISRTEVGDYNWLMFHLHRCEALPFVPYRILPSTRVAFVDIYTGQIHRRYEPCDDSGFFENDSVVIDRKEEVFFPDMESMQEALGDIYHEDLPLTRYRVAFYRVTGAWGKAVFWELPDPHNYRPSDFICDGFHALRSEYSRRWEDFLSSSDQIDPATVLDAVRSFHVTRSLRKRRMARYQKFGPTFYSRNTCSKSLQPG